MQKDFSRLRISAAFFILVLSGCVQLEPRPELPPQRASAPASATQPASLNS